MLFLICYNCSVIFYLKVLIWIFTFNASLVYIFKKKFEETLILSFCIASFILYFFSFFNLLNIAYYLTYIPILIFIFYFIKVLINKENDKLIEFKNNYFRPSSLIYLILLLYLFIRYHNEGFSQCDDFMHWGPMVLASVKENGFYFSNEILKVHNDYPPLFTMYRMIFVGLNNFNYRESHLFISHLAFFYACLLPIFTYIKGKYKIIKHILLTISLILVSICIPMTNTAQEWAFLINSIYLDFILAAFSAYIIYIINSFENNITKYIFITISLSSLLLMKQMGICYYAIIVFYLFIKNIINKEKDYKYLLLTIIIPLLMYMSWSILLKVNNVSGQFVIGNMKFYELINIFSNKDSYYFHIFSIFINTIFTRPLMLKVPFFVYTLLVSIIIYVLNKKYISLAITNFLGSLLYAILMMSLYMLSFNSYEAEMLASFDRYMLSYEYFSLLLLFFQIIFKLYLEEDKKIYLYSIVLIFLIVSVEWRLINSLLPHKLDNHKEFNVLVIDSVKEFKTYREELNGLDFNFVNSEINDKDISVEEFVKEVKENDLLYIYEYDSTFYNKYRPAIDDSLGIYVKLLHEIDIDGDNIKIIPLHVHFLSRVMEYYMIPK